MKTKWTEVLAVSLVVALAAAGYLAYQAYHRPAGTGTVAVTASPSNSPSAPPSPTPTPQATAPAASPAVVECTTAELSAALSPANSAAGTSYQTLALTNSSSRPCIVQGYPGVSLAAAGGAALGQPATRNAAQTPVAVTLAAGQSAYSAVGFPNPGNFGPGQCTATAATLKAYPPDQTTALSVATTQAYCPGFSVTALSLAKP